MTARSSAAVEHTDTHVNLKVLPTAGLPAFILSAGSKDAFDRFIFARHGASAQQAKNDYQQHSHSRFSEHTASYASAVFGRYVDYKVALSQQNLEVPGSAVFQDIADTLDAREVLRRRFFDDHEYTILFADEAAEDHRALSRLRIAGDAGLTARQKKQQIFEQIDALDEQQQVGFLPTLNMHKVAQIKQQFADDTSRYNALAALIGDKPAQRMVVTWQKQAQWQARVEQYRDFRETLRQQRLDTHMQNTLLDEYQRTHFSTNERKRLHVVRTQ
ncbi:lipase secretion chaperone [Salinimonas lutimaris]|uniref:lipase secretion chaperone n=1 Tax=Salinimonas lutimaris TaxID=914153 RepID=UPI001586B60C|nr:lipase secretion chaperone [Salinimonas lutimaris]